MAEYTATCHTPGCGNEAIPITMEWDGTPLDFCVCGPCGQPITDLDPPEVVKAS